MGQDIPPGSPATWPNSKRSGLGPGGSPDIDTVLKELWTSMRTYAIALAGGNLAAADDILQESIICIWEKRDEVPQVKNLKGWAARIVYFKALSFRRDHFDNALVGFPEDIMANIAEAIEPMTDNTAARVEALSYCVEKLTQEERFLLLSYFEESLPVTKLAARLRKTEDAIYQQIARLRRALRRCVDIKFNLIK
ncbi:MAG: sigma-70 family RNA polymerase sigma factor [Puniceicoccales bacterium]|jgi:RNA polymerase sigma-70 factor (ECF subfamily)|nr:sigma-70 family RNA polymerase sigma factor [Puniceicoccales bacterium]